MIASENVSMVRGAPGSLFVRLAMGGLSMIPVVLIQIVPPGMVAVDSTGRAATWTRGFSDEDLSVRTTFLRPFLRGLDVEDLGSYVGGSAAMLAASPVLLVRTIAE